jgi:hypothetical protein
MRLPRSFVAIVATVMLAPGAPEGARQDGDVLFADDFESGLARWIVLGTNGTALRPADDDRHGTVLELRPNGDDVAVLVRDSEAWRGVRVEGEMLFPSDEHSYLGLLYNHTTRGSRRDFGLVYVKGNDSYLQVNPHRDLNVSRLVYPEFHVPLEGPSRVDVGVWQRFAFEVLDSAVHVYIGDVATPQLTFDGFEFGSGAFGLQPRSVGGPVQVDNVRVRQIGQLSYAGPALPAASYAPEGLLTEWQVAGPFEATDDRIARDDPQARAHWMPFPTDWRGAVVSARAVDFHGPRRVAYFRTTVVAERAGEARLELSSAEDLALWVNGRFAGFSSRQPAAWFDFDRQPDHAGRSVRLHLDEGPNAVVLRVIGGVYASGGFFARLTRP